MPSAHLSLLSSTYFYFLPFIVVDDRQVVGGALFFLLDGFLLEEVVEESGAGAVSRWEDPGWCYRCRWWRGDLWRGRRSLAVRGREFIVEEDLRVGG